MEQDYQKSFPQLSIVIPAYNASKTLKKTLDTLMNQSIGYEYYQVILVNDGSSDDTLQICVQYAALYPNIVIIDQENQGVSAARNAGIEVAEGRWISFVDSDDTVTPDYVHAMLTTAPECDYVIFDHFDEKNEKRTQGKAWLKQWLDKNVDISQVLFWICDNRLNTPWDKRFTKQFIDRFEVRFPKNINMGEDLLFNFNYVRSVSSVFISSKKIYCYLENMDGLCHKPVPLSRLKEYESVYWEMIDKCKEDAYRSATNLSFLRIVARYAGQLHISAVPRKEITELLNRSKMLDALLNEPTSSVKNILRKKFLQLRLYAVCALVFCK